MITRPKIRIYSRYNGDLDMWLRTGKKDEKEIMISEDWHVIDRLVEDSTVILNGLGSEHRQTDARRNLTENCEDEETIHEIMKLAKGGQ